MSYSDVGFNKITSSFRGLIREVRLHTTLTFLLRFSGFFLLGLIAYCHFLFNNINDNFSLILKWVVAYILYLAVLEYTNYKHQDIFNSFWFVNARIFVNLFFVSWIVGISPSLRSLLVFAYLIPYILAIVYYPLKTRFLLAIYVLSIVGMIVSSFIFTSANPLSNFQIFFVSLVLGIAFSFVWQIYTRLASIANAIPEIYKRLKGTLNLDDVIDLISDGVSVVTNSEEMLILIIEPEDHSYIAHKVLGLTLSPSFEMNDLIEDCEVIRYGMPFEKNNETDAKVELHFQRYFSSPPRSMLINPIIGKENKVLGLILVASINPTKFDELKKKSFYEFTQSVSSAVETSLLYRKARLSLLSHKSAAEQLLEVEDEVEIQKILVEEALNLINDVDGCILHRYDKELDCLNPVAGIRKTPTEYFEYWANTQPKDKSIKMKLGNGLAGLALSKKEVISYSDVENNPLYVKNKQNNKQNNKIVSIMSAPIFNPDNNMPLGTLSIYCVKKRKFTTEDQSTLLSLAKQGAISLAKALNAEDLKIRGGILKEIFESATDIDFDVSENQVIQQLADIARHIFPFDMVRIRLFDNVSQDLVAVAAAGYPDHDMPKLIGTRIPLHELELFFKPNFSVERSYLIPSNTPGWSEFSEKYLYVTHIDDKSATWDKYDSFFTPLYSESGDLVGYISWDKPENNQYPSIRIINAVGAFASMAGWSIDLKRAYSRISEQRSFIKKFISFTTENLGTIRNINILGDIAVDIGRERLGTEACSLFRVFGDEIGLTSSTYVKHNPTRKPLKAERGAGLSGWVAATQKALYLNSEVEIRNHPGWGGNVDHLIYLPSKKCFNVLIVPIVDFNDKCLGVLSFENKNNAEGIIDFSQDDIQEAMKLAGELGLSLLLAEQFGNSMDKQMLEDDLHELKNKFYYGVQLPSDNASYWLQQRKNKKAKEQLEVIGENSLTILDELYNLHNSVQKRYYELESFQESLDLLVNSFLPMFSGKGLKYHDAITRIHVDCPVGFKLPPSLRYVFIRIASGALMNSLKHSGFLEDSRIEIRVQVSYDKEYVRMSVQDNGFGNKALKPGYGIGRMHDLVKIMNTNGIDIKLSLDSREEDGTQVDLIAKTPLLEAQND